MNNIDCFKIVNNVNVSLFRNHVISVQTCLSSVNNQILYFRFNSGQHLVTCSNWVLLCWVCMKFFCHFQFFRWLRGVSAHSAVDRQSSIPELVRDVKMLKTHFYDPLPMPLPETISTWWYWCCTTPSHTSTPSQLAKHAKLCLEICQVWNFCLICIYFIIYKYLLLLKVKDIAKLNFHEHQGEGHCRI